MAALDTGVHGIGKKLVEEAAETWMAAEHEGRERVAEEISQLLYHTQVMMIACNFRSMTSTSICEPAYPPFANPSPLRLHEAH